MFRISIFIFMLLLTSFGPVKAEYLFGVKTGTMLIDVDGASVDKDPSNVGIMFGYELGVFVGDLSVEAEFTRNNSEGSVANQNLEIETNAIFLSYTTPGPVYFKARGGLMDATVDAGPFSEEESGETYGIGVGFSIGLLRLEVEYTVVDDDVDFISLGMVF